MFRAVPLLTYFLLIHSVCITLTKKALHPLSDEFIAKINSKQHTWTAGRNFHRNTSLKYIRGLMGTYQDDLIYLPHRKENYFGVSDWRVYPRNFDARKQWPHCPTLNEIRDQGSCGSCWAVAAASAMTDRLCINSEGRKNFYFSAQDILSCCQRCGSCDGGKLHVAWGYYKSVGIVSGGNYNSSQGCKPYEIPPCESLKSGCTLMETKPQCIKKCNQNYNVEYNKDKHRGYVVYYVPKKRIIADIFDNGPVTSFFSVYEDFINYKEGVYKMTTGKFLGLHSVKIIGWGEERGVKYWLAANSWGPDWGDNGFFKIIRNDDFKGCDIENNVYTGKGR